MSDVLKLENIRKTYGEGDTANEVLHGINFSLKQGEFSALIGPSGSGKSTLLNMIGLLEPPTSGEIYIQGKATSVLPEQQLTLLRGRSIGFVFQFHHLIPAFNALENVMMPLLIERKRPDAAMREKAMYLLEQVGLADFAMRKPNQLSGGQQQRVAIVRALAMDPPLILADEPTGNLDTKTADDIFALLRKLNQEKGLTFLIVTHDPRLADRCDRIIRLVDGAVKEDTQIT
ncbi:MAG TPA: ABC transporter ATP-binding protein [Pseudomonadales bacterium]|nr:ABC transporter ATP-binding protein [Pseudomonadales bacterium]